MTSDSRAPEVPGRGQTEISTEIFAEIVAAEFFYRYRKCSVETEQNAGFRLSEAEVLFGSSSLRVRARK